jgi:hypothetical protein
MWSGKAAQETGGTSLGDTRHESASLPGLRRPDFMTWLGHHELATLILVLVAAGGTWLFSEIVDLVVEGESNTFDTRVLLFMRSPGDRADPAGSLRSSGNTARWS